MYNICVRMSSKTVYVVTILMLALLHSGGALRCYSCSYSATESSDDKCVKDPGDVIGQKIINCSKKYCVIQRKELLKFPSVVSSLERGCEDKPVYVNSVKEDKNYKTYYRSCTTDLCNSGDGTSDSNSINPDAGAGENIKVKGRSGAVSICREFSILLSIIISIIIVFLM